MTWKPIETAPRKGILLLWAKEWGHARMYGAEMVHDPVVDWPRCAPPTHWMPLPAPPEPGA